MTTPAPVIEIRDLHKAYGALEVLKGVSIAAPKGHVVSLIGSSGSGKSTLLRCCNLLEDSQQGDVLFKGEPVAWRGSGHNRRPADAKQVLRIRTNLSMVFQQFGLFPHMTVEQNVMEGPVQVLGVSKTDARQAARHLLSRVGLAQHFTAYPGQLSGGQCQRVAIARALAMRPRIMLFDEPTSALDPELVGEVLDVMTDLSKAGKTMIVVTHEIGFAREVADRIVFMTEGTIIEEGNAKEVLAAPKTERLKEFLSRVM